MKPIEISLTVGNDATAAMADLIRQAVEASLPGIVEQAFLRAMEKVKPSPPAAGPSPLDVPEGPPSGATVTKMDRANARELRAAYLLGKLPVDGSLLLDTKQVSKLLNISPRTIFRMHQEKAMPSPIHLGSRIQWRVREIIEWVEADCPPQKFWRYSEGQGQNTHKR